MKEHVETDVISDYSPNNRRRGRELQQRLKGPALPKTWFARTVQERTGICNGNEVEPCLPDVHCSVDSEGYYTRYPSDGAAQSQISRGGDGILPRILNVLMMQNGRRYRKGRQQQESQGIPSSV